MLGKDVPALHYVIISKLLICQQIRTCSVIRDQLWLVGGVNNILIRNRELPMIDELGGFKKSVRPLVVDNAQAQTTVVSLCNLWHHRTSQDQARTPLISRTPVNWSNLSTNFSPFSILRGQSSFCSPLLYRPYSSFLRGQISVSPFWFRAEGKRNLCNYAEIVCGCVCVCLVL